MADGVVDATVGTVERHPYIVAGAVLGVVAALWFLSAKKAKAPQSFQFSYGPSDAQVQAGTQLAIAQAGNQSALSIAQLNATTSTAQLGTKAGIIGDYLSYLTAAGNTSADVSATNADYAYRTTLANDSAVTTLGTLSAGNVTAKQAQDYSLGLTTAGYSYNAAINGQNQATFQAQIAATAATTKNNLDFTTTTQANNLNYAATINQQLVDQNKNAYDYSAAIAGITQSGYNIAASKG